MDDSRIIELYNLRDQQAISETKRKYGSYCYNIANRIVRNPEDAAECENDTYLRAWNAIPPAHPCPFAPFLGQIVRRLSLDRYRLNTALRRGGDEFPLSLSELEECIPDTRSIPEETEAKELSRIISDFLRKIPEEQCSVFLLRYWHFYSIKEISRKYGYSQSKVKMMLLRTREKLRAELEKEGVFL